MLECLIEGILDFNQPNSNRNRRTARIELIELKFIVELRAMHIRVRENYALLIISSWHYREDTCIADIEVKHCRLNINDNIRRLEDRERLQIKYHFMNSIQTWQQIERCWFSILHLASLFIVDFIQIIILIYITRSFFYESNMWILPF